MKVLFFSSQPYDEESFSSISSEFSHELRFVSPRLTLDTVSLIKDEQAVCVFVNDVVDANIIAELQKRQIKVIALRCAGFNNVDITAVKKAGIKLVRVPAYSPNAVAEHTVCLMLSLNRKIYRAYNRVREGNFRLNGLCGFDFNRRTIGIVGTGRIGAIVAKITQSMGMKVLAYDQYKNEQCEQLGVEYVELNELLEESDVISMHCPLNSETHHLIDQQAVDKMKQGVMLINTSRGALFDASALIKGLKSGRIGYLGLDVYEQESELFFQDQSCEIIQDDVFERLLTFPNVLITGHQAFLTSDALRNIAQTTLESIECIECGKALGQDVLMA